MSPVLSAFEIGDSEGGSSTPAQKRNARL